MSAFQLPDTHLGAIAKWAIQNDRGRDLRAYWNGDTRYYNFEAICTILAAECFRSVRSRYASGPLPGPISAGEAPVVCDPHMSTYAKLTAVSVLKACASYAYQSCETDDWDTTEAHAIIGAIERNAIHALPGFDAAPCWEIEYTATEQEAAEAEARRAYHDGQQAHADFINSQN